MTNPGTFAFLVHPRARLADDMARIWAPLGRVPESMYETGLRRLPVPPAVISTVEIGGQTSATSCSYRLARSTCLIDPVKLATGSGAPSTAR